MINYVNITLAIIGGFCCDHTYRAYGICEGRLKMVNERWKDGTDWDR